MRKQFLYVDNRTIVAFVTKGAKFANCSMFEEVTARVQCKVRGSGSRKQVRLLDNPATRWWLMWRKSP